MVKDAYEKHKRKLAELIRLEDTSFCRDMGRALSLRDMGRRADTMKKETDVCRILPLLTGFKPSGGEIDMAVRRAGYLLGVSFAEEYKRALLYAGETAYAGGTLFGVPSCIRVTRQMRLNFDACRKYNMCYAIGRGGPRIYFQDVSGCIFRMEDGGTLEECFPSIAELLKYREFTAVLSV